MTPTVEPIDLERAFASFTETWSPRIAAEVNGTHVKLAKLAGEFVWHRHEAEDELFLVLRGRLVLRFREREIELGPGQMLVVPRGVEHQPFAPQECWVLLVEPAGTLNTGDVRDARTIEAPARLDLRA